MHEGAEDGVGDKELAWGEVWALKCSVQLSVTILRWGKNLQAPISRVLTEADRGHGPASGELLTERTAVWEVGLASFRLHLAHTQSTVRGTKTQSRHTS